MTEPAIETINELPDDADDRDLFIRLQLHYVKYGDLERLAALGVEKLKDRVAAFESMKDVDIPYPFDDRDFRMARSEAIGAVREAETLLSSILRKPRS